MQKDQRCRWSAKEDELYKQKLSGWAEKAVPLV